jgi:hypothetical protein
MYGLTVTALGAGWGLSGPPGLLASLVAARNSYLVTSFIYIFGEVLVIGFSRSICRFATKP